MYGGCVRLCVARATRQPWPPVHLQGLRLFMVLGAGVLCWDDVSFSLLGNIFGNGCNPLFSGGVLGLRRPI